MKPIYLLDTNIVSELNRTEPNENVLKQFSRLSHICAISAISWQEMIYGVEKLPDGKRKSNIKNFLQTFRNHTEIIPYDSFAAGICGELSAKCEKESSPISYSDSQIAATAIANNMILISRNISDFKKLCNISLLHVENWFE